MRKGRAPRARWLPEEALPPEQEGFGQVEVAPRWLQPPGLAVSSLEPPQGFNEPGLCPQARAGKRLVEVLFCDAVKSKGIAEAI